MLTNIFIKIVLQGLCATDSDFYPGRLGRMMIINAPSVFTWAWRILQGFLDDIQRSKISVHGSDQEEWKAVLFNLISVDQIPMEYGGKCQYQLQQPKFL